MGSFTMFLRKLAMAAATAATLVSVAGAAAAEMMLDRIMEKREMVMATDPEYPPQSKLTSTGDFEGFDIDVGRRLPGGSACNSNSSSGLGRHHGRKLAEQVGYFGRFNEPDP